MPDNQKGIEVQAEFAEKFHGPILAWVVLVASLIVTVGAWFISNNYIHEKEKAKFEFRVEKLTEAIEERIKIYNQALNSGIGLMRASEKVSREEWRDFVQVLNLEKNWPGIQALGYSILISKEDLQAHISSVRSEGFPDYSVRPAGDRDLYSSIIYIEPFDWRNKRAFGYDMWSNKMRREAMNRAIDTGMTSTSGLITLVQETEEDVQKGFLVYRPFYKNGAKVETAEQRRAAFMGWVYAAFRTGDFMKEVIDSTHSPLDNFTGLQIFDQEDSPENLLFSYEHEGSEIQNKKQEVINMGGRKWILKFTNTANSKVVSRTPQFIALAGVIIDSLLFFVIYSLSTVRKKAVKIAREISSEINDKNIELKEKQQELIDTAKSLENSEQRVQAILDNTVDGIATIDAKGNILTFNKACETLFGYTREEVLNKNVKLLMPEHHSINHDKYITAFIKTGEAKIIGQYREVEGLKKDNTTFPIHLSVSTFIENGEQFFIGIIRDITERKAAEEQMEEMVGQLTESNTDLERFAYIASHDLQEPLRMVINFNNLLKEEYADKLDDDAKQYIEFSYDAALRMRDLISGILEYSRVSGKTLNIEEVDLNETLTEVKTTLDHLIKETDTEIISDQLPKVLLGKIQAKQLIQNMISNAVNYSKEGVKPVIKISCEDLDSRWKLKFSDNGIGIAPEHFPKIFEPFKRLHSFSAYKGSGIGLSLCKKIVENSGGSIAVESTEGEGTSFIIILPKIT